MKPNIHPKLKTLTIHFPDGSTEQILSAAAKDTLHMEIHYSKHPAWNTNKTVQTNTTDAAVIGYNKKFGDFGSNLDSLFGGEDN